MLCNYPRDLIADFNKYPEMIRKVSIMQYSKFERFHSVNVSDQSKNEFDISQEALNELYYRSRHMSNSEIVADKHISESIIIRKMMLKDTEMFEKSQKSITSRENTDSEHHPHSTQKFNSPEIYDKRIFNSCSNYQLTNTSQNQSSQV